MLVALLEAVVLSVMSTSFMNLKIMNWVGVRFENVVNSSVSSDW